MKTHTTLKYYREQHELLNNIIPKMNHIFYDLQEFLQDDDMFDNICRWSETTITSKTKKIQFCFISKEEFTAIKNALNLNKMSKHTDERSYTMTTKKDGIDIEFYWSLPDTCEVITEYEYKDTYFNADDIKVEGDKVLQRTEKTVSIKCGDKSMLEAVFSEVQQ